MMQFNSIRFQQTILCALLLFGLGAYFLIAWYLRVGGYIISSDNVEALYHVAIQLFLPYIAIALGGIFGAARLTQTNPKTDLYAFTIAVMSVLLWDLLALGNVFLITRGVQVVEDVVRFSETTMPVLSTLVAGSIAYYFGARGGPASRAAAQS